MAEIVKQQYGEIVKRYLESQSEQDLYAGQNFSRQFIDKEIAPEELISIHKKILLEKYPHIQSEILHSFDFLIEMMIHYSLTLEEHRSLLRKQEEMNIEMSIAKRVQETLLKTKLPTFKGLDIGYVSIPAKQMSGDYVYFVSDDEKYASVAVADIIGKGIPAALCMSIIKFGMDSMKNVSAEPSVVLSNLNRIVEENIDDSMFISMFYGKYEANESRFTYSSAGHEPAFLYKAKEKNFIELDAKGLLLGVHTEAIYEERSVVLEEGDFIAIVTDGVTEARIGSEFIEEGIIIELLEKMKEENAQEIAEAIYNEMFKLQDYKLQDDFTIVIIKKGS